MLFPFWLEFAQIPPVPVSEPSPYEQSTAAVRSLPPTLDQVPVFNSNSPELVLEPGILLSTLPPDAGRSPTAHLNFAFSGRFDMFAHHVARAPAPDDLRTLYLAVLLHNPSDQPVTVDILQAASYLSQPDAPFIDLPSQVFNPVGTVYAGPGSRVMNDVLRGQRQAQFPPQITIPPQSDRLLLNLPIPVRELDPPINGRSTLMRLRSDGDIYVASLAQYADQNEQGEDIPPSLADWQALLAANELAMPRDREPTPIGQSGSIIYGRVAGVSQGSQWVAQLTDPESLRLAIPAPGQSLSYGLSTLYGGRLGTEQIQSAPLLVRYPDTAYQAHGNYGVEYQLTLPLTNPTAQTHRVALSLQTPVKMDELTNSDLVFLNPLPTQTFFRGTVRVRYQDEADRPRVRYLHLVQRRGQAEPPLLEFEMPPASDRLVSVDFLYPPDATPPQVLTITTTEPTAGDRDSP